MTIEKIEIYAHDLKLMSETNRVRLTNFLNNNPHLVDRYTVHPAAFLRPPAKSTELALEIVTKDISDEAFTVLAVGMSLSTCLTTIGCQSII